MDLALNFRKLGELAAAAVESEDSERIGNGTSGLLREWKECDMSCVHHSDDFFSLENEEQLAAHTAAVRRGALEGTAFGMLVSGAASLYAHRRIPAYRTLPLSLKALGPIILIAPLLTIQAERRSLEYDESQWTGEGAMILNERERKVDEKWKAMNTSQKISDWASRHEYSIILGSWALSLGVAGAIISRDKYQTSAQKVVQARMWAQGLTIGILIAAGALKHSQRNEAVDKHIDHSWQDVQREREAQAAHAGLSAATKPSVSQL
ncbi:hypothetical protein BT96DRAFT_988932 [Gymnopus androsaceus JB14]|uniref:HIG1 domain-containing protein n=1 Tax=Gymnopus androsaceus JB14 TaxID=1447944 RepID=A0A6A4I342_9AGAR|nr:hypothetical protein BT96DRAFT_988932 [Gymnopus androsaceus JB14]